MVILQQTRNSELAVLPVEEISLAPDPDADASAPEAPADSDDTNGTEAAAASDARLRLPTRKLPPPHSPLPRQCPPCPDRHHRLDGRCAGKPGSLLLACGWFFTRKSKHS